MTRQPARAPWRRRQASPAPHEPSTSREGVTVTRHAAILSIAVLTFVIGTSSALAQPATAPLRDTLAKDYPDGVLYVTYNPLAIIRSCVNDAKKWQIIRTEPGSMLLKQFLASHFRVRMNESAAFLVLDFAHGKAGFKRASDEDARITWLTWWSPDDVVLVAVLVDRYVQSSYDVAQVVAALRTDTRGPDRVLQRLNAMKLTENPYVPAERLSDVASALDSWARRNPEQLRQIQRQQPGLWSELAAELPPPLLRPPLLRPPPLRPPPSRPPP
jgi:hypothetical protein